MGLHLGLGLTGQRVNASPASLFTVSGSRGFMYDLSDYGSQWQDTAGTVPITSTSQSVARVNDVSGLGNHATQATLGNRPLTTTIGAGFRGIQFDGVDDWLQTAAIDFSNSDEVTVVAGVRKLSDAARASVFMHENAGAQRINLEAPSAALNNYNAVIGGTLNSSASTFVTAPNTSIIGIQAKIATPAILLRRNGAQVASSAATMGTGNFSNAILYIGQNAIGTQRFNGVLTFLFTINRLLTANELASVEAYANARTGAF